MQFVLILSDSPSHRASAFILRFIRKTPNPSDSLNVQAALKFMEKCRQHRAQNMYAGHKFYFVLAMNTKFQADAF